MAWFTTLLVVVQVLSAVSIIILVLLQHGKGADMGAAFGSGASGSLFGATGSANFLSRSTAVVATVFFLATLGLAYTGSGTRAARPESGVMGTMQKDEAPKGAAGEVPKPDVKSDAKDAAKEAPKDAAKEAPASKAGEIPK